MCNSIFLSDKTLPDAKDGENVSVTIKGVYRTDEDGIRKLDVTKVDGKDVGEMYDKESECGCDHEMPEFMDHNADDALRLFIIKTKKG